ncbi:MAG: glutathione S-transferase, partial [Pseudomonadota bacterium]
GFSAADIAVGQAVYMAAHFTALDVHPALADWYARITERPAFQACLPAPAERLYGQPFYPAWSA